MKAAVLLLANIAFAWADDKNILDRSFRVVQKEAQTLKQPIDETIAFVGSSQCSNVKKIVGVAYEQVKGENEPDLTQLKLEHRDNSMRTIYNIEYAADSITQSTAFNPNQKLYIFIHGFTDDPTKASFSNISDAFLSKGDCNILALDGSSLIRWLYLRSTTYVRFMGEKLGEVLAAMVKRGVNPADIHIIGHSLGSHISGFTGKQFANLTGQRIGRISGLDPAGPCFSHIEPELRLKEADADYVDVIHTDGGVYGLRDPVGHADYYPNSGAEQPNCLFQTCSHSRAWLYFSESVVTPEAFVAVRCKDWDAFKKGLCEKETSFMGYPSKPSTRGTFFLQTGEDPPYGLGDRGAIYQNNDGIIKNVGAKILSLF